MNRGNSVVIRQVNEDFIRSTLIKCRAATKMQLADITGLSIMTVGTVLTKLVSNGEVVESEMVPSEGGRPARMYRYDSSFSHVVTVFISSHEGQRYVYVAVSDAFGNIVYKNKDTIVEVNQEVFVKLLDEAFTKYPDIKALGIGIPGIVNNGLIQSCDYEMLNGFDMRSHYSEKYKIPVIVENDVNCAVYGYCGSEVDINLEKTVNENLQINDDTAVYLFFPGTFCPGSGIWINGELYRGFGNMAGEIGSIQIDVDWQDPSFYSDKQKISKAICYFMYLYTAILSPRRIILSGSFIQSEILSEVKQEWSNRFDKRIGNQCEILLSSDFESDYWIGLIKLTQKLLAPKYEIKTLGGN